MLFARISWEFVLLQRNTTSSSRYRKNITFFVAISCPFDPNSKISRVKFLALCGVSAQGVKILTREI